MLVVLSIAFFVVALFKAVLWTFVALVADVVVEVVELLVEK